MKALALVAVLACQTHQDPPPPPPPAPAPYTSAGVPAGGIVRDANEGPSAVIASSDGDVTVRRVGELAYTPATAREPLWGGDEVRTGERGAATIVLADRSVIEVAEASAVAIASRYALPDPASAAAVLFGVARFTVTPRAPGEGMFLVLVPSGFVEVGEAEYDQPPGIVVFGVGVAIDGRVRLATETGLAVGIGEWMSGDRPLEGALDETPGPIDWGAWRVGADARADLAAALVEHGKQLLRLEDNLALAYEDLVRIAEQCARFERKAAVPTPLVGDPPRHEMPDGDAWFGAAFATALRLQVLTWQFASRAALASEIYARHPELGALLPSLASRADAAIVWPKRYEATAAAFLAPLRLVMYVADASARVKATVVGVTVPPPFDEYRAGFYEWKDVHERTETPVWDITEPDVVMQPRPVWALDPPAGWDDGLVAAPGKRATAWYTRHDRLAPPVIVGVPAKTHVVSNLVVQAAQTRDQLRSSWQIPINETFHVKAPDLALEQRTRARLKLENHRGRRTY